MKSGPILVILAACGLLAWLAPAVQRDFAVSGEEAAPGEEADRLAVLQRDQWLAGEVVLPRADDGHFYAEVSAESGSARMLVDTGASVIALTGEDANAMGVAWNEADLRPVGRGAGGAVLGVPVTLERVSVGNLEAQGVEAVVVPEGLHVSLLGQSFLQQIERVEVAGDEMTLGG